MLGVFGRTRFLHATTQEARGGRYGPQTPSMKTSRFPIIGARPRLVRVPHHDRQHNPKEGYHSSSKVGQPQQRGTHEVNPIKQMERASWSQALAIVRDALYEDAPFAVQGTHQQVDRSALILKALHILSKNDPLNWRGALWLAQRERAQPTAQVLGTLLRVLRLAGRWEESVVVLHQGSEILRYEESYATVAECAAYLGMWSIALQVVACFHSRIRASARREVEQSIPSALFHAVLQRRLSHTKPSGARGEDVWWAAYTPGLKSSYLYIAQRWCMAKGRWEDVLACHARLCSRIASVTEGERNVLASASAAREWELNNTRSLLRKCNVFVLEEVPFT